MSITNIGGNDFWQSTVLKLNSDFYVKKIKLELETINKFESWEISIIVLISRMLVSKI